MSFTTFLSNPKSYLALHQMEVRSDNNVLLAMNAGPENPLLGSMKSQEWSQKPGGPFLTMMKMIPHGQPVTKSLADQARIQLARLPGVSPVNIMYQTFQSAADIGFRWLQFKENFCTYMSMDAAATFFITGPLSGCTIAAGLANDGVTVVVLHANCNKASGQAARITQAQMLAEVAKDKMNATAGRLSEALYHRDYDGLGFVFGRKIGATSHWKFYAYGMDSGVKKIGEI
ncbi:MAG TPA: hypothetical protein VMQ73_07115 [Methylomirabilota bacterium]|nr:hypothetical protein [Methylomirabilota bacterium]